MQQQQLGNFAPELLPELSQYHTPLKLARRMVKFAGFSRRRRNNGLRRVIEPSAGGGNIMRELLRVGFDVEAVEIDPRWADVLRSEFPTVDVVEADFLKWTAHDRYDIAVMNPPLNGGVAGLHIRHALRCARRVVSLVRAADLYGINRYHDLWSQCDLAGEAKLCRRPAFGGDWHTGKTEFSVIDVRRRGTYHEPQRIEHWADDWS